MAMLPNEPVFPRGITEPKNSTGEDVLFVAVLIILAALVAVLWFAKSDHQLRGELHVESSPAQPVKP